MAWPSFDPNSVIQAYLAGLQLKQNREDRQAALQMQDERMRQQQQQFQQREKRMSEQFDAQQSLRQATFDIAKAMGRLRFGEAMGSGIVQGTPVEGGGQQLDVEGLGTVTGPTPEQVGQIKALQQQPTIDAQTQAAIDRAVGSFAATAPLRREEKIEEEERLAKRQKEMETFRQGYRMQLAERRFQEAKNIVGIRHSQRLREIEYRDSLRRVTDAENQDGMLSEVAKDLETGRLTQEALPRMGLSTEQRQLVLQKMQTQGSVPLNQKQVEQIQIMSKVTDVFGRAREITELVEKGDFKSLNRARQLSHNLQASLGVLAKTVGSQTGALSDFENRLQQVQLPDVVFTTIAGGLPFVGDEIKRNNRIRLEEMKKMMLSMKRAVTGPMTPQQELKIDQAYGLLSEFEEVQ